MIADLRLAVRNLARSPGYTVIALLTLALGIGLSASSFSLANAFLLRDLNFPDPGRLVRIFRTSQQSLSGNLAPANALHLREHTTSFSGLALFNFDSYALGEAGQPPEQVPCLAVTPGFFDVLQVQASMGRLFQPAEEQVDPVPVAVITHRTWLRRYGGNPDVVGRSIRLNSLPCTIVGVLPPSFHAPLVWGPIEYLVPRSMPASFRTERSNAWMQCIARLRPGAGLPTASAELNLIAAQLAREFPREVGGDGLRVVRLHDSNMDGVSRNLLWLMTALSVAMLLIACANLASLQVARALGRGREYAVRAALGGSRRQLMTPLMVESLVLSLLGGFLGVFVAIWSNDLIGSRLLINNEPGFAVPLDARVLLFTAGASLLSGVAFGLTPAWLAARSTAAEALKEGSRSTTGGPAHQRLKHGLIITELALALALVGAAASFGVGARSFLVRPLGWEPDGLYSGYIALPHSRYPEDKPNHEFHRALLDRLAALPGAELAVLTTSLPVYSLGRPQRFIIEGADAPEPGREPLAAVASITSNYFPALKIPLREGAGFAPGLKADDPPAVIVNESLARRFWPGRSAVGRRLRLTDQERWLEVTGVCADMQMAVRLDSPETPFHLYYPLVQRPSRYLALVVRTAVPPETMDLAVRQAVAALDPDLPVAQGGSIRSQLLRNFSNLNLVIFNLGLSAGMGLLIAGVGLFGVMSQLAAQRTRDIGVRMALGASPGDILRLILGEGLRMLVAGILAGVPLLWALNRILSRAMPSMELPGLWLLGATLAVLGTTMLLACWLPARRATKVNPVEALHAE